MRRNRKRWAAIGLAVGVLVVAAPMVAADKAGTKIKGWGLVIDPDKDCQVTSKDGGIGFTIPTKPHDLADEIKVRNSPRVVSEVTGDFIAEVKVSGQLMPGKKCTLPAAMRRVPYHGAGLFLMKDDATYVTMVKGAVRLEDRTHTYANFEIREGGRITNGRDSFALAEKDVWLRLERRGDRVIGSVSLDGVRWGTYDALNVKLPETLTLGIYGVNTSDVPFTVRFDNLTVFKKAPID